MLSSAIKTAISLQGNAVAHFNLERRKSIMKHLNKDLQPLAKGSFPDRGPWLFGEGFDTKAKTMSDNIKALKSTLGKRNEVNESMLPASLTPAARAAVCIVST
jgi:hypothetical protein